VSDVTELIEQTRVALERAPCQGVALGYQRRMLALLSERRERAFSARSPGAHFTASAFVLREDSAPLAILHAKLNRWLQPGGHMELSDLSPLDAARRELVEETSLSRVEALSCDPVDVDIHLIPARGEMEAHEHFDLRYGFLLRGDDTAKVNHEARRATWLTGVELERWLRDPSIARAYQNTLALLRS